jgi:hypothetical protein
MESKKANVVPSLTIVIVVLQGRDKLARCLTALGRQENRNDLDIIVTHDERFADLTGLKSSFPDVAFIGAEGRLTYAALRSAGVRMARGGIVAITEDHCMPRKDWAEQIIAAHAGASHAAIGGAVEKAVPDTTLNWALYLADYLRYMNPVPEGPTANLTDCNVSYKCEALNAIAPVWSLEFHEPEVHEALQGRGESLWLSPEVVVYQQRSMGLNEALRDRYAFGRLFGGRRAMTVSPGRRMIYAGSTPLLPALLTGRVIAHGLRKRRHGLKLLQAMALVLLLNSVWAWGEFIGYVTGRADESLTPDRQDSLASR